MHRIVIVGGGLTGLTAAYTAVQEAKASGIGVSVTVVEKDSRWGGKIFTQREDGLVMEFGADAILRRKPWAIELCHALGIEDKLVPTAKSGSFVRWNDRMLPLPPGLSFLVPTRLAPFLQSPLFTPAGKARFLLDYFLPPRPADGDESLGAFVRRRLGDEALERLAEPLLSGIYAGDIDQLSLQATFPQLRAMELEHGSLIRATLAQAKKQAEAQKAAAGGPSVGSGPSVTSKTSEPSKPSKTSKPSKPASPFVSLQGGITTLIETLVEALAGHELICGEGVREIAALASGVEPSQSEAASAAVPSRYRVVLEGGRTIEADAVILATPAYVQAGLLEALAPRAAAKLREIEYASLAGVVFVYPKRAIGRPMDGTGYLVPRAVARSVTACTWASEKWGHVADKDTAVLRCHFGKAGREDVSAWSDERLIHEARAEVEASMAIHEPPAKTFIYRWPRALPQYTVGHLDRIAAIEEDIARLPGLVATGAAYRGVGVPDCVRQGQEAARSVLKSLSSPRQRGMSQ